MSVEIWILHTRLSISRELEEEALVALLDAFDGDDVETLEEALEELGWEFDRDGTNTIVGPVASLGRCEEGVFDVLGPFVKRGSFVLLTSNEAPDEAYGYVFTGRACHEWDVAQVDVDPNDIGDDHVLDLSPYDEIDDEEA